jgi:hypothetical protein
VFGADVLVVELFGFFVCIVNHLLCSWHKR